jgi:hypothetical protein
MGGSRAPHYAAAGDPVSAWGARRSVFAPRPGWTLAWPASHHRRRACHTWQPAPGTTSGQPAVAVSRAVSFAALPASSSALPPPHIARLSQHTGFCARVQCCERNCSAWCSTQHAHYSGNSTAKLCSSSHFCACKAAWTAACFGGREGRRPHRNGCAGRRKQRSHHREHRAHRDQRKKLPTPTSALTSANSASSVVRVRNPRSGLGTMWQWTCAVSSGALLHTGQQRAQWTSSSAPT